MKGRREAAFLIQKPEITAQEREMLKTFTAGRMFVAGLIAIVLSAIATYTLAQSVYPLQQTLVGNELIQIYPAGTAGNVFTSTSNLRDGRMWVYNVPLTGFTLTMTPLQSVVSLNPAGTLAAGTILMPPTVDDGKSVSVFSSQTITALTFSTSNSATFVPAAPTTIAANASYEFVYDKANNQWHRFQ